jgi:hypothetical protein
MQELAAVRTSVRLVGEIISFLLNADIVIFASRTWLYIPAIIILCTHGLTLLISDQEIDLCWGRTVITSETGLLACNLVRLL